MRVCVRELGLCTGIFTGDGSRKHFMKYACYVYCTFIFSSRAPIGHLLCAGRSGERIRFELHGESSCDRGAFAILVAVLLQETGKLPAAVAAAGFFLCTLHSYLSHCLKLGFLSVLNL